MIALAEEAARRGEDTFHAPYRLIGDLAGVQSPMTVMRRLGAIGSLGFLSLVEPGIPGSGPTGVANVWMWIDPPRPGETEWNGAGCSPRSVASGSGSGSGRSSRSSDRRDSPASPGRKTPRVQETAIPPGQWACPPGIENPRFLNPGAIETTTVPPSVPLIA
jgi:hypothetical protein